MCVGEMASGIVRSAISAVVDDGNLTGIDSLRAKNMIAVGKSILQSVASGEAEMSAFDTFSEDILRILKVSPGSCANNSIKRERLWTRFHAACITELPEVWRNLFSAIKVDVDDDLLQQSTNRKLFEVVLPSHFSTKTPQPHRESEGVDSFTTDELNAMQYACGYVPRALLRKYEKRSGGKFEQFVECLGEMAVDSEDSDFLTYTKTWIEKVNRGGLFPLNDVAFIFFTSVEKEVRDILPRYMATTSSKSKEDLKDIVIEKIVENEEVQWNWTLVSQCIIRADDSNELLREIITLWVTIRGFSIVASWMETYKAECKRNPKKQAGLRKGLKKGAEC